MTKRFKVYPYKMGSQSARSLSVGLSSLRVRQEGQYRPRPNHIIINWGNSNIPDWLYSRTRTGLWVNLNQFINPPQVVAIACNKRLTLQRLSDYGIPVPEYTDYKEKTLFWINEGHKVFCRTQLTGHSGQGIVLASSVEELVDAPLYTKYTKAKLEFRVHVMNNQVIDFVQKKKRIETPAFSLLFTAPIETNHYIRSHRFGWVFTRDGVTLPDKVKEAALGAIQALGLDFGAVDIGYKVNEDKAFVYECNTAPGLEGTTLQRYIQGFKEHYL
jgi:hypothetical protein